MGATEEAGKAVGGFLDALKTQPLSLALVVMNLALLAMFYFILTAQATSDASERKLMYEAQRETQQLLAHCTVPAK